MLAFMILNYILSATEYLSLDNYLLFTKDHGCNQEGYLVLINKIFNSIEQVFLQSIIVL